MKKKLVLLIILSVFILFGLAGQKRLLAVGIDERIAEYQKKIAELQGQEKSLSQQIALMTNQINVAGLKISQTEGQIKTLEEEIESLSGKIVRLDGSLDYLSGVLLERVEETYRIKRAGTLPLLFSSSSFSDFVSRYRYMKVVQEHDRQLLLSMEQTRTSYDEQKTLKEKLQVEMEVLKKKLTAQKAELNSQSAERKKLLDETKQDEKKYQQLLAQAFAEKAAIEKALVSGVNAGPVKKGDAIALVGNSGYPGCSTGKHLHFEVRKNDAWTDPGPYLSGKTVLDDDTKKEINVGSGSWPWPIQDTVRLTQFYGRTPYSWRYTYSGGIHTGYDMVSTTSDVIRAPADGTLFKSSQLCGSSTINIVYIEHGDNLVTFYLHVQ